MHFDKNNNSYFSIGLSIIKNFYLLVLIVKSGGFKYVPHSLVLVYWISKRYNCIRLSLI